MSSMNREIVRFLVVGFGSNILNFLVYFLVHAMGAPLMVASVAGYLVGLFNSYHFGRNWVFDARNHSGILTIVGFSAVYAIGGIGMSGIIEALDRTQGLDYRLSWFFGALFAFTNNFVGAKWLVFKSRETRNGN